MSGNDLAVVSALEEKVVETCTCERVLVAVGGNKKESKALQD